MRCVAHALVCLRDASITPSSRPGKRIQGAKTVSRQMKKLSDLSGEPESRSIFRCA